MKLFLFGLSLALIACGEEEKDTASYWVSGYDDSGYTSEDTSSNTEEINTGVSVANLSTKYLALMTLTNEAGENSSISLDLDAQAEKTFSVLPGIYSSMIIDGAQESCGTINLEITDGSITYLTIDDTLMGGYYTGFGCN